LFWVVCCLHSSSLQTNNVSHYVIPFSSSSTTITPIGRVLGASSILPFLFPKAQTLWFTSSSSAHARRHSFLHPRARTLWFISSSSANARRLLFLHLRARTLCFISSSSANARRHHVSPPPERERLGFFLRRARTLVDSLFYSPYFVDILRQIHPSTRRLTPASPPNRSVQSSFH
jgi:hypothetical protein